MNPDEILGQLDFEKLLETYDGAANKLLAVARQDGHFDDAGAGDVFSGHHGMLVCADIDRSGSTFAADG